MWGSADRAGAKSLGMPIATAVKALTTEIALSATNNLLERGAIRPLPPGTIDIWLAGIKPLPPEWIAVWLRLLSEDELNRYERFVSAEARLQHLTARVLVRTVLSRYANVAPETWRFEVNAFGRPAVGGPATGRDLRFNLSHTNGLVALAIAENRDVGIDVEWINQAIDVACLAPSIMARTELKAFETALPGHARRELFFAFWTLKEAYIKARGMGFSLPLDGISFDLSDGRTSINFNSSLIVDDPARWLFCRLAPTPLHALALAAEGPSLVVRPCWTALA